MFPMNQKSVNKLTALGMMCALVFVSNYLRITMPIAIGGRTSFTLANIMCCLSGLLLGPVARCKLELRAVGTLLFRAAGDRAVHKKVS